MRSLLLLGLLISQSSFALVEFVGTDWHYGTSASEVVESIGISSDPGGNNMVVLNLANQRQVKLSREHSTLGLSLLGFQGKCIKIIPGFRFESVAFILNCD